MHPEVSYCLKRWSGATVRAFDSSSLRAGFNRHWISHSPVLGLSARCPLSTSTPRRTSSSRAARILLSDIAIGFSVVTSAARKRRPQSPGEEMQAAYLRAKDFRKGCSPGQGGGMKMTFAKAARRNPAATYFSTAAASPPAPPPVVAAAPAAYEGANHHD